MNKVPGKVKISYLFVEIFEHPLNIPKCPSIVNIGIFYNYGPGVRGMNTCTFVRTLVAPLPIKLYFAQLNRPNSI